MDLLKELGKAFELSRSCINPAIEATKKLLLPFEVRNWLRLALVVFLASYMLNGSVRINAPTNISIEPVTAAALVVMLLVVGVGLLFISSAFQFVFVQVLLKDKRSLWNLLNENLGRGLQLIGFTLLLMVPIIIVALLFVAAGFLLNAGNNTPLLFLLLILGFLVLFPLVLIIAFAQQLTYQFVTLVMVIKKVGVVEGWKQLLKMIGGRLTYWVVFMTLSGIIGTIIGLVPLLILMLPMLLMGMVLIFLTLIGVAVLSLVPEAVAQLLILLSVIVLIGVMLLLGYAGTAIFLPIPVFMRYLSIAFFDAFSKKFGPFPGQLERFRAIY